MRRTIAALLLVVAVALVAGCSSGDGSDGEAASTTAKPTTTTTMPEVTDEEIIANINETLRPSLEGAFEPDTVDCIMSVLEEGGTGELNADQVVPEYDSRCGVTATKVTGVITGAELVERGASPEQGRCLAAAIEKMTYDQVAALDEDATNALYGSCGIDVDSLAGG